MPVKPTPIEALTKISGAITSDLYLDDVLKLIVTITAQTTQAKLCSLMLVNEKTKLLEIRATQSVSEGYNKKPALKIGEGITGKVVLENRAMAIYDVQSEKEYKYKEIARKEGIVSLLCVPLTVKDEVIGVINLYSSKPHKFTKNEIGLLTTIANQAALVIKNTELMVRSKIIQEELETRKISERAKGILMRQDNIGEEEAYRLMQKYSMDSRKSLRQVAEAIVMTEQMRHKSISR